LLFKIWSKKNGANIRVISHIKWERTENFVELHFLLKSLPCILLGNGEAEEISDEYFTGQELTVG